MGCTNSDQSFQQKNINILIIYHHMMQFAPKYRKEAHQTSWKLQQLKRRFNRNRAFLIHPKYCWRSNKLGIKRKKSFWSNKKLHPQNNRGFIKSFNQKRGLQFYSIDNPREDTNYKNFMNSHFSSISQIEMLNKMESVTFPVILNFYKIKRQSCCNIHIPVSFQFSFNLVGIHFNDLSPYLAKLFSKLNCPGLRFLQIDQILTAQTCHHLSKIKLQGNAYLILSLNASGAKWIARAFFWSRIVTCTLRFYCSAQFFIWQFQTPKVYLCSTSISFCIIDTQTQVVSDYHYYLRYRIQDQFETDILCPTHGYHKIKQCS